jgi:TDG/mug DNA glycosylase family protein
MSRVDDVADEPDRGGRGPRQGQDRRLDGSRAGDVSTDPSVAETAGADPRRPTRDEISAAEGAEIPDVIARDLAVLFCGINPGLYSGAVGHHFARPGNRFWGALQASGFTDRLVSPHEDRELLAYGLGVTNLVGRSTAGADELTAEELRRGAEALERKVEAFAPAVVAVLGIGAYRVAFSRPRATVGPQAERIAGARLWVLPNPSGLNAHYQAAELAGAFAELRACVVDRSAPRT